MLALLDSITADTSDIGPLVALFAALRPKRASDGAQAIANVRTLSRLLRADPVQAVALRDYALRLLTSRRHSSLYTEIGVLSNDGFFTELKRRIAYRILPPALGDEYLSDALDQILPYRSDHEWVGAVPAVDWLELFDVIFTAVDTVVDSGTGAPVVTPMPNVMLPGILEAIRTLSYRVAALGLEPKLTNFHTEIEVFDSPFTEQNKEVNAYLDGYALLLAGQQAPACADDARHLLVMLDQCDTVLMKIRKKALSQGTSVALTYLLVGLAQSIDRLRKLLFLVDVSCQPPETPPLKLPAGAPPQQHLRREQDLRRAAGVALALELITAHNNKYTVRDLFAENINLLARNITENASRTGEHYIAENRREMRAMFLSSAGAGLIIGFMALIKILMGYLRAAPLVEAFLFSLNYSLGFVLIHLLHFTVATKQPAMTASRIAASLQSRDGKHLDMDTMAELVNKVFRTQVMAVLGNLATAIPTAWLIAYGWHRFTGHHLVSPDKAMHLLHDIDPIGSPALFYAMIAGVCLFLAGLISGYYDNKALYTRWAQRIAQLRGLGRVIGQRRLQRLGVYLENNLGGLMGNAYFGILLGTIGTLGFLLGLPVDIRHVTFSSANFATAIVGLDHNVSWQLVLKSVAGFLAIGTVNLLVSFGLALWVALRSRKVRFQQGTKLLKALGRRFMKAPIDFFIGSRETAPVLPDDTVKRE